MILALSSLAAGCAQAHDFWLEAGPYYSQPGDTVDISLHVGNHFVGDSQPNIFNYYDDFSLYNGPQATEIEGNLGDDPAGRFTPERPGTYLVGHQTTFSRIDIDAKTFNKYLQEEGLDNAIRFRQLHGLGDASAREDYIRHAKLLVQAGQAFEVDNALREIGYILEITPLQNPYRLRQGDRLSLKVKYRGQPSAGLLLIAFSRNHPERSQNLRTDEDGIATIVLDDHGPWLTKAVKILRSDKQEVDWQSHWASLTFSIAR